MDKNTIQKLKDAIAKSTSIGIAVGENPAIDEMGAALALYLLLGNANKRVTIASPTNPIVEISSLVGIDRVQRNFGGTSGDLVVSFPYKEGEIEKVSYTLENNFLNIIVKSSEQGLSFMEQDVHFSHGSGNIDLLIVVGAAQLAQIGDVIDSQKLTNVSIVNIDNDPNNQGFGDIVFVRPQDSSVSELVADIALTLGFAIDRDSAQNLLSGIMTSTQNFQNPKTSSLAFEISSYLMKRGALRTVNANTANFQQNNISSQAPINNFTNPQTDPLLGQQAAQTQTTEPLPRPQQVKQPIQSLNATEKNDMLEQAEEQNEKPPLDWLTPKVYKGSSEV